MRHSATIVTLLLAAHAGAIAADFSAWQYTQSLPVTTTGLTRVDLPPATLNVAHPRLEDLRVISPSGAETPMIINWPELQPERLVEPGHFEMRLGDGVAELHVTTGTTEPIRAIHLRPATARFIKAVRVDSSSDGTTWQSLTAAGVIFREPGDVEFTTIKLQPQSHTHLRVVIDDTLAPPVPFSGARLELGASSPDEAPLVTAITNREELKGRTRLTLDLGGRNAFVATLRLAASDPVFNRRATVHIPEDGSADDNSQSIASSTIFRVTLGDQTTSSLDIPVHRSIASDTLIIDIDNGDSPPLKIDAVDTTQHPVRVLFHASETGNWRLISGNPLVSAPRYDITAIKQQLTNATANPVIVGALTANQFFAKPTALPDIDAKGVSIDLARSRYRKPVTTPATGVISLQLDPEVLSHSQTSLHDLRMVQDGRQIPFITDVASGPQMPFVEPTIELTPDPKRPTTTRWTITMPFDSLPSNQLTCVSPTALFERQLSASATVKDSYGNDSRLHLGSARWSHKPGDPSNEFSLRIEQDHVPRTFTIETDNGDNPPIELTRFRIHHPTVRLIAKLTDSAPLYLYYGNDRASRPEYDLRLVQAELASAPKENATLGSEEKLITSRDPERASSAGSPWLWLALALVVGVLLWVVAKMLPKAPDATV